MNIDPIRYLGSDAHLIRSSHTSLFSVADSSLFGVGPVIGFSAATIDGGGGGRGGGLASGSIGIISSRREVPSEALLGSVGRRDGPGSREEVEPAGERERRE